MLDDVLIYSRDWKEHLGYKEDVLAKLRDAGLMAKKEKCEWGRLGHLIGKNLVAVPEDSITNYVQPTTRKESEHFWELLAITAISFRSLEPLQPL